MNLPAPSAPLRRSRVALALFLLLLIPLTLAGVLPAQEPHPAPTNYNPPLAAASDEGLKAIPRITVPNGLKVELFAAEPLLANPVAFAIDEKGRFFVAETFRHSAGVTDNRSHGDWLDDDLASRTVADRLAMLKKFAKNKFDSYAAEHDRVRLVEDKDGDGKAETASVFADDFHGHVDGIGSGLLAREGNVYFTCIPDLWLLRDDNNDGKAEIKKSLQHGYGVHVAFLGHDLHGLRIGPDGKLYFTVGDRGLNVKQGERTIALPDEGAVLRCNLDGSDLEIVATGLRNPQELAFDDYGNLFTCDNNSDSGDRARWVHIVEGGDSGWRMSYQYHDRPVARGPWNAEQLWNAEKQWNAQYDGYASYIIPPLANISDGPSGLCFYPGTGLPIRYNGHFFLCDFRGASGSSGVRSLSVRPKGATFEVADLHEFAWKVLATDCEFGPDGGLYVSDWVEGWNKTGKGRIYRISDPVLSKTPVVTEVRQLLGGELAKKSPDQLAALLKHADQRVRQEAQFALAKKGASSIPVLLKAAEDIEVPLARIHALWGLGQVAGKSADIAKVAPFLAALDVEVRAQAARVLGDSAPSESLAALVAPLLKDPNPRVRFFGAMAYGKLGRSAQPVAVSNPDALAPIYDFLRSNNDADPYLRHAGVMALAWRNDPAALALAARDPSPAVRMGVLLAMRRLADPRVATFLHDIDPRLVLESARAINDVPIEAAMPELAALATRTGISEHVQRRALNAQFRIGEAKNATVVAAVAARLGAPEAIRTEALSMLGDWEKPSGRDRVLGLWRPLAPRSPDLAAAALRPVFAGTLSGPDKVRQAAVQLAGKLGIRDVGPTLFAQLSNPQSSPAVRAESLRALESLKDPKLSEGMKLALADTDARVRSEGRRVMAQVDPAGAVDVLRAALDKGEIIEQQGALAALAGLRSPDSDQVLSGWLDKLVEGQVPAALRLDLLEAVRGKKTAGMAEKLARYEAARPKNDPLARYRDSLEGGDAEHGKRIFLERAQVQCQRCHKVAGVGGEVGPDLSDIGGKQKREYLLEALVDPNRAIAKGYETVIVETSAGQVLVGVLREENAKELKLITAEGRPLVIAKSDIESRTQGKSAMPDTLREQLTPRDVRDLVEFLSGLKK